MNNGAAYRGILESIESIRESLPHLTEDERKLLFDTVSEGYCKHCGSNTPHCPCTNDE